MKADRRIVRVPTEDLGLETGQVLCKGLVRLIDIEPDSEQTQVAMMIALHEVERVIAGLVDIKSIPPASVHPFTPKPVFLSRISPVVEMISQPGGLCSRSTKPGAAPCENLPWTVMMRYPP